jgi:phage-related minor tail protein
MALQVGELYATLSMESKQFDKDVGGIKGALGNVGGMVATTFAGIMAGAIGAVGGAMAGAVIGVNNYQKAMNGLQAQTGATSEEMASMGEQIKNIYSRNYGESFQDIGDAMAYVKQTTGAVGEELEYLTQDALMLRDTFGYDVNESVRGASQLMKEFGVTGTEAMSMIAEGTQKGLNRSDDLIDTIDEYSVYFKTAGLNGQEMFAIFENASKAGVRNLDYVGDAFKEFVIRSKDGSKTTKEAFTGLGLDAQKMGDMMAQGGEKGKEAFLKTMEAINAIEDPVERNAIGVSLFGTKFEDLEADAISAMGNLNGTIKGSVDTLNEINEIKYDSFGEAMKGIGRQLFVGLIMPLGEKLMPHLNNFANWIASKLPTIQAFFQAMGQKIGAVFGGMGSKIGTIKSAFSQYFEMLKTGWATVWSVISPLLTLIGQKVMEVFQLIIDWWNANGSSLLENVMIVFQGIWNVIKFIMPGILAVVSMVFESIKGVISGALNIISGVFAIFAGLFTGNWSKMWDGVKQLLSGAIQFIWNLWNLMLFGRLISGIKLLWTKGLGLFKGMWTGIQNGFGSFVAWIQNLIAKGVSSYIATWKSLFTRAVQIFNSLRSIGFSIFNAMKQAIYNTILTLKNMAVSAITNMKSRISTIFGNIKSTATRIFNGVKNAITKPIETAKNVVLGIIDTIKSAFSKMKIKIPKPKLPKINVGSKKVAGIPIPTFDLDWFKNGGVFNGPSVIGVGEAGAEAVVPLSGQRMKPFATEIMKQMMGAGGLQTANDGRPVVVELVIDGQRFARATAKHIKDENERIEISEERGRGKRRS